MDFNAVISAPFGQLGLREHHGQLAEIVFLLEALPEKSPASPLLKEAVNQLQAYFRNPRAHFELPLASSGSAFQQRVWQALRNIPPGSTSTYGELAKTIGSAPRAVGQACGSNPLPIIVPCHRVLSASGQGGFMHSRADGPLSIKHWLLAHERG
jgi:methylated-DNA-[protein]-cysteine S-methyltransferase